MSSDDHNQTRLSPRGSSGREEAGRDQARSALSSRLAARSDASGCRKYPGARWYWGINVACSCPRGGRVARRSKKSLRRRHGLAERSRRGWLRAVSGRDGGAYPQERSGPCTVGSNWTRLCELRADTSRSFSADVPQRASRFHPTDVAIGCRRRTRCTPATVRAVRDEPMQATLTLPQAAQMVVAWSLVHGFAMLLLDDRLKQLIAKLPPGVDEMAFLPAILTAALPKT